MSMKTMMPRGLTERPMRDSAGLGRLAPCTRRQRGLPTRSLSVPRSRSPHPISPVQDVEVNDGSQICNAMGLAVLLSSVLAPAAAVAATRPLLDVAASPEVVKTVSSALAIPAVTFGVVSMAKVMDTITQAQRALKEATMQRKAKQRHEAYLAEHPEEAQALVSDAVQSASASAAYQLEAEQTHAAATFAEGGQAWGPAAADASHAAGQDAADAATEATAQEAAERLPTAVADAPEQSPSLAARAAARERELAAARGEVVVEGAVTEQAVMGAAEVAHGAPQLKQRSRLPAALREVQLPPLQSRPASPSHDSVSQAAAAVIAAPTAGAPALADAAGAEAADAAREALQAELAVWEAEYAAKIDQLREHVRQEQAARPRPATPTRSATEAQQMAEEYEAKLVQVRQESAAKLEAQAQEAAQREEQMAALQARRQRPPSPLSPAGATPPPAARADKVPSLWKRAQALMMSIWAWLVSLFGGRNKPRMA